MSGQVWGFNILSLFYRPVPSITLITMDSNTQSLDHSHGKR